MKFLLQAYCPLFLPFCEQGTPQLTLLLKMQEYCYDNMNFMKSFHKIVLLFYKSELPVKASALPPFLPSISSHLNPPQLSH